MGYFCPKNIFHTSTLLYFLAQTLHTFDKSSPSKFKFSDFPLLALKFTKFFMSFFKQKFIFPQSLDHSSVSWDITLLYLFSWNVIYSWQKEPMKVQIFRLPTVPMKINQILHVIYETASNFSFKVCMDLQYNDAYFLFTFLAQTLNTLVKRSPLKCKFWVLRQNSPNSSVIFQSASQFLLKFCIILQCYDI